jgi:hypothetical protein
MAARFWTHSSGLMPVSKSGGLALMPHQQRKPQSFGADCRLACSKCNKLMLLTWRAQDADYGGRYQRQTFSCPACKHRIERSVDVDGNPPELERY